MDLVSQTSAKSGMKLKIALVATKCESTEVPATLLDSSEALLVWQVAILCSDPQLKVKHEEMRPFSWHKYLVAASKTTHMTLQDAHTLWDNEKEEFPEDVNLSAEEIETLKAFYNFTTILIEEDKAEREEKMNIPKSTPKKGREDAETV